MRKISFITVALLVALRAVGAPATWDLEALSKAPAVTPAEGFDGQGCKALYYTGTPYQGKPTRVFAWYGVPEGKPEGGKWPAMVLVHGGGGTAFYQWVQLWNKRGYAAIAMDTCGSVPRGEYNKWERDPQGGPPGWGGLDQIDQPVEDQWSYHAVADVILAHSLIRSFPEVDAERVGLTGISWGGYLTCILAGVDPRYKLAVPVYGCGFLGEDSAWVEPLGKLPKDKADKWLALWDPSVYLPAAKMPMLWVTGTNDFAFPMDSLQKSYRLPGGPRALAIRPRMPHGHGGAGENPEEIHAAADHYLKGGPALPAVKQQTREGNIVRVVYEGDIAKAELEYTKAGGVWKERLWEAAPAQLDAAAHTATATLPEGVKVYYVNLFDAADRVVSSEHEELGK